VIHAIRKLAREIHRRSVWQVVAVYVLLGWGLLVAAGEVTTRVGLPSWTPAMTLVLVVLGLPMVIATAVVQEGIPWLRIEDYVDPNELEGLTPEQVHVIPQAHPLYNEAMLTWRNAVLLGVMSGAVLVTSVVAYLMMWALGIGPVGSLLARGAIGPADTVIVTQFTNRTDDASLGPTVTDAFAVDLAQTPVVSVLVADQVAELLVREGRDPAEPVTPTLARQLASEARIAAMVEGDIARLGGGYRITVRIVLLPGTESAAEFRRVIRHRDELIDAVDALSERVRAKFGESLRVIRAGTPLSDLYAPTTGP